MSSSKRRPGRSGRPVNYSTDNPPSEGGGQDDGGETPPDGGDTKPFPEERTETTNRSAARSRHDSATLGTFSAPQTTLSPGSSYYASPNISSSTYQMNYPYTYTAQQAPVTYPGLGTQASAERSSQPSHDSRSAGATHPSSSQPVQSGSANGWTWSAADQDYYYDTTDAQGRTKRQWSRTYTSS